MNLDTEKRNMVQQQLLEQTRSTTTMLNNLVTWSKGQMQGMKAHPKPFSPISVLEEIVKVHDPIAQHKGIVINIHTNTDHKIYADPDMISIALRNLINNAIKFTRNSGNVDVYIEAVDNRLTIKINDNGVGIKKEEAFKLLTGTATATYGTNNEKGMGLGLLLAKEYIEANDGKLNFESEYGKGSSFLVELPMAETELYQ
jgi:signal transduction histidine kinase